MDSFFLLFFSNHTVITFNLFQAAISALQYQPVVNAVIDGDDIIYRDYIDISIAVGTPKVCQYSCYSYEDLYLLKSIGIGYIRFCCSGHCEIWKTLLQETLS